MTNTTSCKLGVFNDITWDNNSVMNKNIKISVRHIDFSNTYYLTIIRDINLNNQLGQVIINLDLEQFNVLFESRHKNTIYMATAANEVLYTLDTELIGKNMTEIYQFSDRFLIDGTLFDKKDEVGAVASDKYDIKYFSIVSDSYYDNLYIESIKYGLTIVILNFVLCFIISALLSVEIFTPIDSIFKMISNRPQAKKDVAKNNEINYIFYEINNMKNMNEKLKKEIDYYMAMVNETQIKALQAQIKPHFLFNTLENVIWKIRDDYKRDTEATQILIYLSQMLRYALNMNTKLVPISEEIEQLKIYIKLLQIRYVDKFDVIWNVDPNAVNYKIIKLTLQPIVENCIYHGIKPLKDKGKVKIDVLESKDHIKIVIEDFGIGMNQEQVNKIKANLENEVLINDEHIGIINTNKRLNLFFGVEYGMNIESKPNYGTKVEIIIPKIKD